MVSKPLQRFSGSMEETKIAAPPQVFPAPSIQEKINKELQKSKVARLFAQAIKYGIIRPGWTATDYMIYAAEHNGWESTGISGTKGTLKSNLLIQHGLAIYQNIATVRKYFVTRKKTLLDLLWYAIDNELTIPWLAVDDIAALFPKSLYFTHRKMYSKLQSAWETVRTVMHNFEFSCVIKKKVATFIMEDTTGDIKTYDAVWMDHPVSGAKPEVIKSHYDYRRWMWLRSLKDPTKDIAKLIAVEDIPFPATPHALANDPEFNCDARFHCGGIEYRGKQAQAFYRDRVRLRGLDPQLFSQYWDDRLKLTKDSFSDFASILDEPVHPEPKQKLTPEQRSEQASNAAKARWCPKTTP